MRVFSASASSTWPSSSRLRLHGHVGWVGLRFGGWGDHARRRMRGGRAVGTSATLLDTSPSHTPRCFPNLLAFVPLRLLSPCPRPCFCPHGPHAASPAAASHWPYRWSGRNRESVGGSVDRMASVSSLSSMANCVNPYCSELVGGSAFARHRYCDGQNTRAPRARAAGESNATSMACRRGRARTRNCSSLSSCCIDWSQRPVRWWSARPLQTPPTPLSKKTSQRKGVGRPRRMPRTPTHVLL